METGNARAAQRHKNLSTELQILLFYHRGESVHVTLGNVVVEAFFEVLEKTADTYFAKPYSAWERGLNQHTNGFVRQYFPKSTDFTTLSADEIQKVEDLLNNRPRTVPGFRAPMEVFSKPSSLRHISPAA